MVSSDNKPFVYEKSQLIEVICQLRFPTILSIEAKEPADYQDQIRGTFPRYVCQSDPVPGPDGKPQQVRNHTFITEDGAYKISLTKDFIALSTMRYPGWEGFAHMLDEPLVRFIGIYQPAYFSRIGLRYLNAFSREKLGLAGRRWNDLIQPQFLGILDDDAIDESEVVKCAIDVERRLGKGFGIKLHAGPGSIRRTTRTDAGMQTVQEPETRFILDLDVYANEYTPIIGAAPTLEQLHTHADRVFSDAITDTLHDAMEPVLL